MPKNSTRSAHNMPEETKAVADVLAPTPGPLSLPELEARFRACGCWRDRLPTILDTLEARGYARRSTAGDDGPRWQCG